MIKLLILSLIFLQVSAQNIATSFNLNRSKGSTLKAGQTLKQGEYLSSQNGEFYAVFQTDGNFVVYRTKRWEPSNAKWSSGTRRRGAAPRQVKMQLDGNLKLYDVNGSPIWSSGKGDRKRGSRLVMQNDGNLVIYNANNLALWQIGADEQFE